MKKTLKVLMAIILFAVVLTLATSVKAASLSALVEQEETKKQEEEDKGNVYAPKIVLRENTSNEYTLTDDLEVDDTVTMSNGEYLDLGTHTLTIKGDKVGLQVNGKANIKGTGKITQEANSTKNVVVVPQGGELVVNGATIEKNAANTNGVAIENAGKVDVLAGTVATIKILNNDATVFEANGVAKPTFTKAVAVDTKWNITGIAAKDSKDVAGKVYGMGAQIEITSGGKAVDTITIENGDVKKVNAKATLADYELTVSNPVGASDDDTAANIATIQNSVLTAKKVGTVVFTYTAGDATKKLTVNVVKEGTVVPNPDDDNNQGEDNKPGDDNNQGEDSKPGDDNNNNNQGEENNDNKNNNDLDETPKTGDQIIPATAILAVVVVANVVYFAKMKRN